MTITIALITISIALRQPSPSSLAFTDQHHAELTSLGIGRGDLRAPQCRVVLLPLAHTHFAAESNTRKHISGTRCTEDTVSEKPLAKARA
eukprot:2478226-Rhodomonas_salina.1